MCIDCWCLHLEAQGTPSSNADLARLLELPPVLPETAARWPTTVADDRLLGPGGRSDNQPRNFSCDRCHVILREGAKGSGGTFLFDLRGRHMWSFDAVRPVVSASGTCLGLQRSCHPDRQPPPVQANPEIPDALPRAEAWKSGQWDATWMCLECAAGLFYHQPAWLADVAMAGFSPSLDMGPVWLCQDGRAGDAKAARKPSGAGPRRA